VATVSERRHHEIGWLSRARSVNSSAFRRSLAHAIEPYAALISRLVMCPAGADDPHDRDLREPRSYSMWL
jgi:hypothetical protein